MDQTNQPSGSYPIPPSELEQQKTPNENQNPSSYGVLLTVLDYVRHRKEKEKEKENWPRPPAP